MAKEKLKILVVDDSATTREMLVSELKVIGYTASSAGSAEQAEDMLKKSPVDILLLDLKLPGMEGLEYLEKLRSEKRDVIVIVMTAYESARSAVEAIERGAYDYVIKPVEPKHLELIIKRALKRFQIEQERRIAIERRISAAKNFLDTTKETELLITELKREVNSLLKELGRPLKYRDAS